MVEETGLIERLVNEVLIDGGEVLAIDILDIMSVIGPSVAQLELAIVEDEAKGILFVVAWIGLFDTSVVVLNDTDTSLDMVREIVKMLENLKLMVV